MQPHTGLGEIEQSKIDLALKRLSLDNFVEEISLVYGDLSPRRYFRINLSKNCSFETSTSSLLLMYFDSVTPPEAETKILKSSFAAYCELTEFLLQRDIPVPKIYLAAEDLGIILVEDLGSTSLICLAKGDAPEREAVYFEAVKGIHKFQSIPKEDNFFAFQRGFDARVYIKEMSEFADFLLPKEASQKEIDIIHNAFSLLAKELEGFEQVLVHRDYHSWNLMIDTKGDLRVIDFQDALIGTRTYDLIALAHERDVDSILGDALVTRLEDLFFSFFDDQSLREEEYPRAMLQRDLKVAGRFAKVARQKGLMNYASWIPGTVRRIELNLKLLSTKAEEYKKFLDVFHLYFKDESYLEIVKSPL